MIWIIVGLIVVLGAVIFVHEMGHYIAARIAGVRVNTFSIGFGPALLKWTDRRGTKWKLAAFPLGGYVMLHGNEDLFDREKYYALPAKDKKGHYLSVSLWRRAMIAGGGVFLNFALAFAIYWGLAMRPTVVQLPVVAQVIQESVAYAAGVRAGDTIVRIDGEKITNWGELILAKELTAGRDADVIIVRGENLVNVKIPAAERWGLIADGAKTEIRHRNIWQGGVAGMRETWRQSKTLVIVLKQMITGERSSKQLGSFIMIAEVSGKALAAGIVALLSIIALLSVNLAIINLIPLPVLDGGTLFMIGAEGITRKKLPGKVLEYILWAGWILIILLFAFTMKNDIFRVFGW
ncbi:MAG: M50 family metallopeptidase [Alphaproteobacteria bacterium]|nr:M50 family metallopeptidase [Alphaproteobacteria bacterium]MCL2889671.1 M50 family metallopeptidase [Alphaproteobacteria bacterium]